MNRAAATRAAAAVSQTYVRKNKRPRKGTATQDLAEEDDSDVEMTYVPHDQHDGSDSKEMMEDESSQGCAATGDDGFQMNDNLLS